MANKELVDAISRKIRRENQELDRAFQRHLRRHGETEESIQRYIPKAPPPRRGPGIDKK